MLLHCCEPEQAACLTCFTCLDCGIPSYTLQPLLCAINQSTWHPLQIINKLWYTGLGAREIVQHSAARLSRRLQVCQLCMMSRVCSRQHRPAHAGPVLLLLGEPSCPGLAAVTTHSRLLG